MNNFNIFNFINFLHIILSEYAAKNLKHKKNFLIVIISDSFRILFILIYHKFSNNFNHNVNYVILLINLRFGQFLTNYYRLVSYY